MNLLYYVRVKNHFQLIKSSIDDGVIFKVDTMCEIGASGLLFEVKYDELASIEDIFAIKDDLIYKGIDEGSANSAMYNVILSCEPSDLNAHDVFMSNLSGNEVNKGIKS